VDRPGCQRHVSVRAVHETTCQRVVPGFATPQGVTTAVEVVRIGRLADRKVVEHWAVREDLALMMQLGVVKSGKGRKTALRRSRPGGPSGGGVRLHSECGPRRIVVKHRSVSLGP
jgi:hypothetical protein